MGVVVFSRSAGYGAVQVLAEECFTDEAYVDVDGVVAADELDRCRGRGYRQVDAVADMAVEVEVEFGDHPEETFLCEVTCCQSLGTEVVGKAVLEYGVRGDVVCDVHVGRDYLVVLYVCFHYPVCLSTEDKDSLLSGMKCSLHVVVVFFLSVGYEP